MSTDTDSSKNTGNIAIETKTNPTQPELTEREQQVYDMLAKGAVNKVIANSLGVSDATVKAFITKIFKKLGLKNRVQVAIHAALNAPRYKNLTEDDEKVIFMIALRAQRDYITRDEYDTFIILFKWLCFAHSQVGAMRLTELLDANNHYFFHDVKGILKNLNKTEKKYDEH